MLVYRDSLSRRDTLGWLRSLRLSGWDRFSLGALRDRVVDFGEFESALTDVSHPEVDEIDERSVLLRRVGRGLATAFLLCARGDWDAINRQEGENERLLTALMVEELPGELVAKAAEGFAFWGLYPEQYADAARRIMADFRPRRATVLGLRNIGAGLASIVEAYLALEGVDARSFTLRPRGHPFRRTTRIGPELIDTIRDRREGLFLVVDEGPGMSGSSLASVTLVLEQLGVPTASIILVPSHAADAGQFVNADAAKAWRAHLRVVGEFQLRDLFQVEAERWVDASAGKWRVYLKESRGIDVAVQPQHERLKFLEIGGDGSPKRVRRFAGLGRHGRTVLERAKLLESSLMVPRAFGMEGGMIELEFVSGRPLEPGDCAGRVVSALANYIAFRRREFRRADTSNEAELATMARTNIAESLGERATTGLEALAHRAFECGESPSLADARMFPHEWLRVEGRLFKVDAWDHGDDHFYPGICDVAWDLAGAIVEFGMDERTAALLVERYARRSGDQSISRRLPFYRVAYLAFRVGYCTFAQRALGDSLDGRRFERLLRAYTNGLSRLLPSE